MKILMACYSWKGHTRTAAHELAKKPGATDTERLTVTRSHQYFLNKLEELH